MFNGTEVRRGYVRNQVPPVTPFGDAYEGCGDAYTVISVAITGPTVFDNL